MPIVSVIIPAYNSERFVAQAVVSALNQTIQDTEIIVVDDGSTDGTADVVRSLNDPRIRYVLQPRQERSAARNRGIAMAQSGLLAFLDADDAWELDKLEKQLAVLETRPDVGLVSCLMTPMLPNGELLRRDAVPRGLCRETGDLSFQTLLLGGFPGTTSILARHSAISAVGGFGLGLNYGEDWDLALRISVCHRVALIPEPLVRRRVSGFNMPRKMHAGGLQTAFPDIVRNAIRLAGEDEHSDLSRRALARAYAYGSFVDMGVSAFDQGLRRLSRARELCEGFFSGARPPVVEAMVYFACALYDTSTPLAESLSFIRVFYDHLDVRFADFARTRKAALGWVSAIHVFLAASFPPTRSVRRAFLTALLYDRSWFRNRGFLKLGLRAWLPTRLRPEAC